MALELREILIIQSLVTFMMTGVIWQVQLVTYPLFHAVKGAPFLPYHDDYTPRITKVVLPLMGSELLLALYTVYYAPTVDSVILFAPVALNWILTFFIFVPLHSHLSAHEEEKKKRLVKMNWIRTFLWSFRSLFLLRLLL